MRIKNFTPLQKSKAWQFAQSVYKQAFESSSFTKRELDIFLDQEGFWTFAEEQNYTEEQEKVNLMKVDYFENFPIPSRREYIKKNIDKQMARLSELLLKRSYLYEFTCENIRDESYLLYFFKSRPNPFLFYRHYLASRMSEFDIRELCFDNTWRMIWATCKDPKDIFGMPVANLNDNQLSLLYWSKLYDNIGESPDSPTNAVMRDQLAIDGWMIKQGKKRDAEEKTKDMPQVGELFIPVGSKREAAEITSLNTAEGKRIIKSRANDIKTRGDLDERQFSHIKQDISMQVNSLERR